MLLWISKFELSFHWEQRERKSPVQSLQETLAHAIFERIAAFHGVKALRVRTSKPDVYPEAHGVGAEIASFAGAWPDA